MSVCMQLLRVHVVQAYFYRVQYQFGTEDYSIYVHVHLFIIHVDIVPLNTICKLFAMNGALPVLIFLATISKYIKKHNYIYIVFPIYRVMQVQAQTRVTVLQVH